MAIKNMADAEKTIEGRRWNFSIST